MGEENPARHDAELAPIVQHAKAQLVSKNSAFDLEIQEENNICIWYLFWIIKCSHENSFNLHVSGTMNSFQNRKFAFFYLELL